MFYECFTKKNNVMATVKIVVLKHHQREDKTWNVKIRITHGRESAYISTQYYVGKELISQKAGKFELKANNNPVYDAVTLDVLNIRKEIVRLGHLIDSFTAKRLCAHMEEMLSGNNSKDIHFFPFAYEYFEEMTKAGRAIGVTHCTRIKKFQTFVGSSVDLFTDITSALLYKYEEYLKKNDFSIVSIIDYISVIHNVFSAAKLKYNDEDAGIIKIPNNPFVKYKYPKKPVNRKKALTREQIQNIMTFETKLKGVQIARDAFIISFLLCGINSADLYYIVENNGRVDYERRKTKDRRADNAFISIKIEPELLPYIDRYKDNDRLFSFYQRNSSHGQFNRAVNEHLKVIGKALNIDGLTFYAARHSWATIARNDCGIPMEDIAICLNHKSRYNITDQYIKRDWGIIDAANRKVIDYLSNINQIE